MDTLGLLPNTIMDRSIDGGEEGWPRGRNIPLHKPLLPPRFVGGIKCQSCQHRRYEQRATRQPTDIHNEGGDGANQREARPEQQHRGG